MVFQLTMTMLKIWSQNVLDAWVLLFGEITKKIPYSVIEEECNKQIMNLGDNSQPVVSR